MNKLKLNLEDLRIEQFETEPGERNSEGTVIGHGRQVEAPGSIIYPYTEPGRFCLRQPATHSCGC